MAHTEVFLSNDAGILVPSLPSVTVSRGDTIAFSLKGTGDAFAFFSPGSTAILKPAPESPVALSTAKPVVFTFNSSEAGSYSVFFEPAATASVPDFPSGKSNHIHFALDRDGTVFGTNADHPRRG